MTDELAQYGADAARSALPCGWIASLPAQSGPAIPCELPDQRDLFRSQRGGQVHEEVTRPQQIQAPENAKYALRLGGREMAKQPKRSLDSRPILRIARRADDPSGAAVRSALAGPIGAVLAGAGAIRREAGEPLMEGIGHDGVETEIQPAVSGRGMCRGRARLGRCRVQALFDDLVHRPAVPRRMSRDYLGGVRVPDAVLAQDFPQVFNQLPFVLKGQPFAVMVPIVIKLLLDDGHARSVLEQGPDQIEIVDPGR